ncbi:hypothetical protein AXG93_3459s1030 [Marchantia polymorpha subsp. ruderalis]|uniref:Uncharacterized protein n=1 Tax=Marchantia polymorpha subsp. ruderalis TaxID=1480154 RepID=A0A176W4A3_MARPO|nr:hypothetical protein AXG93_3459s1030 [Marchantia polymorpha subsp. ruderalis]
MGMELGMPGDGPGVAAREPPPLGYRPHPERWQVSDWEQVLGRCAGEEGDFLFECESVQVTKEEEISFEALFKNCKSSKNGYKTRDYKDRKRRNVPVALLQILQPHRTTYMTFWQVGYVKDVEVDTDTDEARASTPPARPRADDEPRGVRAPRKRKWDGEVDQTQREAPTAPVRLWANHELASRPKQKAHKLALPESSADIGRAADTRNSSSSEEDEPSAQAPSAVAVRAGEAGPPGASSPTPLEVLARRGAEVAAEEAARVSSRELPRIYAATEILETEDNTTSEEEEVESVQGTPTGVLCEQVVPLLWYLDRKATKFADPRHRGSYVKLIRNRTRIKVATNPELIALDQKY